MVLIFNLFASEVATCLKKVLKSAKIQHLIFVALKNPEEVMKIELYSAEKTGTYLNSWGHLACYCVIDDQIFCTV